MLLSEGGKVNFISCVPMGGGGQKIYARGGGKAVYLTFSKTYKHTDTHTS